MLIQQIYNTTKQDLKIPELNNLRVPSGTNLIFKIYKMMKDRKIITSSIKRAIADILWKFQENDINDPFLGSCKQDDWRTGKWAGYYQFFFPVIGCDTVHRPGLQGDGGKFLCNPHNIVKEEKCIVYSFGAEADMSFDKQIHYLLGCNIHTFDPFLKKKPDLLDFQNFYEFGIGPEKDGSYIKNGKPLKSLKQITTELNHKTVDILKIDVEGSEHSVFENLFTTDLEHFKSLKVKMILLEYHYYGTFDCNTKKTILYPFLKRLYRNGYFMYRYEHNVYTEGITCPGLCCVEYAFIHRDYV